MVNEGNGKTVNCELVWREVSNYLEGDVDANLRTAMDDHFRTCAKCASVLAGTRNVIRLYGDERMIEVPAGFGHRLERRLARDARLRSRGWSTWSAWLVPVAALVLFAGGLRFANSAPHPMRSEMEEPAHGIPPDMVVVVTAGAKEFHRPGCGAIHNKATERTLTAKQAIEQGYVPCARCLREYLQIVARGGAAETRVAETGAAETEIEAVAESRLEDRSIDGRREEARHAREALKF